MKKTVICMAILAVAVLAGVNSFADEFSVSVKIPAANTANFEVFKITDPNDFPTDPIDTINLVFTTHFDPEFNTFLGNEYYAINVAPLGGSGAVNVQVNYSDVTWPTDQLVKLGGKGKLTAVAVKVSDNTEVSLLAKSLIESEGQTVLASSIPTGHYMRFYVALADGTEPGSMNVEPFTSGDKPGDYIGTLILTALAP